MVERTGDHIKLVCADQLSDFMRNVSLDRCGDCVAAIRRALLETESFFAAVCVESRYLPGGPTIS